MFGEDRGDDDPRKRGRPSQKSTGFSPERKSRSRQNSSIQHSGSENTASPMFPALPSLFRFGFPIPSPESSLDELEAPVTPTSEKDFLRHLSYNLTEEEQLHAGEEELAIEKPLVVSDPHFERWLKRNTLDFDEFGHEIIHGEPGARSLKTWTFWKIRGAADTWYFPKDQSDLEKCWRVLECRTTSCRGYFLKDMSVLSPPVSHDFNADDFNWDGIPDTFTEGIKASTNRPRTYQNLNEDWRKHVVEGSNELLVAPQVLTMVRNISPHSEDMRQRLMDVFLLFDGRLTHAINLQLESLNAKVDARDRELQGEQSAMMDEENTVRTEQNGREQENIVRLRASLTELSSQDLGARHVPVFCELVEAAKGSGITIKTTQEIFRTDFGWSFVPADSLQFHLFVQHVAAVADRKTTEAIRLTSHEWLMRYFRFGTRWSEFCRKFPFRLHEIIHWLQFKEKSPAPAIAVADFECLESEFKSVTDARVNVDNLRAGKQCSGEFLEQIGNVLNSLDFQYFPSKTYTTPSGPRYFVIHKASGEEFTLHLADWTNVYPLAEATIAHIGALLREDVIDAMTEQNGKTIERVLEIWYYPFLSVVNANRKHSSSEPISVLLTRMASDLAVLQLLLPPTHPQAVTDVQAILNAQSMKQEYLRFFRARSTEQVRVGGDYDFADWITLMVPESASGLFKPYRRYAVTTVISGDGERSIDFNSDSMYTLEDLRRFIQTEGAATIVFSRRMHYIDDIHAWFAFEDEQLDIHDKPSLSDADELLSRIQYYMFTPKFTYFGVADAIRQTFNNRLHHDFEYSEERLYSSQEKFVERRTAVFMKLCQAQIEDRKNGPHGNARLRDSIEKYSKQLSTIEEGDDTSRHELEFTIALRKRQLKQNLQSIREYEEKIDSKNIEDYRKREREAYERLKGNLHGYLAGTNTAAGARERADEHRRAMWQKANLMLSSMNMSEVADQEEKRANVRIQKIEARFAELNKRIQVSIQEKSFHVGSIDQKLAHEIGLLESLKKKSSQTSAECQSKQSNVSRWSEEVTEAREELQAEFDRQSKLTKAMRVLASKIDDQKKPRLNACATAKDQWKKGGFNYYNMAARILADGLRAFPLNIVATKALRHEINQTEHEKIVTLRFYLNDTGNPLTGLEKRGLRHNVQTAIEKFLHG